MASLEALEQNFINLGKDMQDIKTYIDKGIDRHVEVMSQLAVISHQQKTSADYQLICDKDRSDHEKRITSLEDAKNGTWKVITAAMMIMAFFITSYIQWFHH